MGFLEKIELILIRICIHPFLKGNAVEFKETLRDAKHLLLIWPHGENLKSNRSRIEAFTTLFPKATCTVIQYNEKNRNLWRILRSEHIKKYCENHFDVILDLDPHFNPLSAYLCRVLYPSIRIGLTKPFSHWSFNFQYDGRINSTYSHRLDGLFHSIKTLLSQSA